jgi:hypothetical protein
MSWGQDRLGKRQQRIAEHPASRGVGRRADEHLPGPRGVTQPGQARTGSQPLS